MGVNLGLTRYGAEHRVRVFENRVLRRLFGHEGDEVTGEQQLIKHH
jgi:hypothetical protein